jgi:hypothetical protein
MAARKTGASYAQRIPVKHLRDDRAKISGPPILPAHAFWDNIRPDLTGATLIDFNLVSGAMADANCGQ